MHGEQCNNAVISTRKSANNMALLSLRNMHDLCYRMTYEIEFEIECSQYQLHRRKEVLKDLENLHEMQFKQWLAVQKLFF